MQAHSTRTQPPPAANVEGTPTRLQSVLHGLVDMTESLARAVHAQAMAQAAIRPEANAPEHVRDATAARTATLTAAFDRIARTLRRSVLLAHHLDRPDTAPNPRTHARTRIIRGVEDAIDRARHEGRAPDPAALRRELLERLDSPALDDDLAARPLPELVEELCRDLGVHYPLPFTCPPRRRTPADIAAVRTEAQAQPGTRLPDRHREVPLGAVAVQEPGTNPSGPPQPSSVLTAADLQAILGPPGLRPG